MNRTTDYIYKSSLNIHYSIVLIFLLFIPFIITTTQTKYDWIVYFIFTYLGYVITSNTLTYIEIYEDKLQIVSPLKLEVNRRVIHHFNEIILIKDIYSAYPYGYPLLKFYFNNKKQIETPKNSFPVYSFSERRSILKYFNSKGIPIEILSEDEKEINILSD